MVALVLFIKNIFGWITLHWKFVAGAVAVLILVIGFGVVFRACNKSSVGIFENEGGAQRSANRSRD